MRILIDCRWYDNFYSGVTTYIQGILKSYNQNDADLQIYLIAKNVDLLREIFGEKYIYLKLPDWHHVVLLHIYYPRIIKQYSISIAHFQYITPMFKACKYVVTIHDLLFISHYQYFKMLFTVYSAVMFYISALRSDLVLSVSEFSKESLEKYYRIKSSKIKILPNGLDFFKSYNSYSYNRKYITYVSRIEPRKNHKLAIEAFIDLKLYERYTLIFVGKDIDINSDLKLLINKLCHIAPNRFEWESNVSHERLDEIYNQSALCVYPSFCEGFGIPPLESMIRGIPTICSNATALAEFNSINPDGMFDPKDKDKFYSLILAYLSGQFRPKYDNSYIQIRYNWFEISNQYLGLLREININN